jgi:hypothetical protein
VKLRAVDLLKKTYSKLPYNSGLTDRAHMVNILTNMTNETILDPNRSIDQDDLGQDDGYKK